MNDPILCTHVTKDQVADAARQLFDSHDTQRIVTIGRTDAETRELLESVDVIVTDADGTLLDEGYTTVRDEYVDRITELHYQGVRTAILTGKPFEEARAIIDSSKKPFEVTIVCEKGAYSVEIDEHGEAHKSYLLSSPELEQTVREVREAFIAHLPQLVDTYRRADGTPRVGFGWSGSGQHTSVISVDIFDGQPPDDYLDLVGEARDALKLRDPELLDQVQQVLEQFFHSHVPDARVVHLGNGNTEFAPGSIEKDNAIEQSPFFATAHGVLCLGDSFNDMAMFKLAQRHEHTYAGLIVYREASLALAPEVDFVTTGMANIAPYLQLVGNKKARV